MQFLKPVEQISAVKLDLQVAGSRVKLEVSAHLAQFPFLQPRELNVEKEALRMFVQGEISSLTSDHFGYQRVVVLPRLTSATLVSIHKKPPENCKGWDVLKQYWEKIHGYRLQQESGQPPRVFYNVEFASGRVFTYPEWGVRPSQPTIQPGSHPLHMDQFLEDFQTCCPQVCGQAFTMPSQQMGEEGQEEQKHGQTMEGIGDGQCPDAEQEQAGGGSQSVEEERAAAAQVGAEGLVSEGRSTPSRRIPRAASLTSPMLQPCTSPSRQERTQDQSSSHSKTIGPSGRAPPQTPKRSSIAPTHHSNPGLSRNLTFHTSIDGTESRSRRLSLGATEENNNNHNKRNLSEGESDEQTEEAAEFKVNSSKKIKKDGKNLETYMRREQEKGLVKTNFEIINKEYRCRGENCNFKCKDYYSAWGHVQKDCSVKKKRRIVTRMLKCTKEGCDLTFKVAREMQNHYQSDHQIVKEKCPMCGKEFKSRVYLVKHMKREETQLLKKEEKCLACGKICSTRSRLKQHMESKHKETRHTDILKELMRLKVSAKREIKSWKSLFCAAEQTDDRRKGDQ